MNEDWIERRQRLVKCKIHGLHYDPQLTNGCSRCQKDGAKSQPRRSPQLTIILLCVLGMTVILYTILGPGQATGGSEVEFLRPAYRPEPSAELLDPELYRRPVQALEAALYRSTFQSREDLYILGGEVARSTRSLSDAILDANPTIGRPAAEAIARLGQDLPEPFTARDLERLRGDWLRLRKLYLQPAPWLDSASDSRGTSEQEAVVELNDVANSLVTLLEDAAAEATALQEPEFPTYEDDYDISEAGENARFSARWQTFLGEWGGRVRDLRRRMALRPDAGANNELLNAVQLLEQALARTEALAADTSVPRGSRPAQRFEDVISIAERARQQLDDLVG